MTAWPGSHCHLGRAHARWASVASREVEGSGGRGRRRRKPLLLCQRSSMLRTRGSVLTKRYREPPLRTVLNKRHAVIAPVSYAETQYRNSALRAKQSPANFWPRHLALIDRDRGRVEAVPNTSDDAANKQLRDRRWRAQQYGSNDHDRPACKDHCLSSKALAAYEAEEAACCTTNVWRSLLSLGLNGKSVR